MTKLTADQRRRLESVKRNPGRLRDAEADYLKLNAGERREFDDLEKRIEAGMSTFVEIGTALAEVREKRLYREHYDTFADYLKARWNLGKSRAYQLINAAELVETSTQVDRIPNERVARELAKAPAKEHKSILDQVEDDYGDITPSAVANVIHQRQQKKSQPAPAKSESPSPRKNALVALAHLVEEVADLGELCQSECDLHIKAIRAAINKAA